MGYLIPFTNSSLYESLSKVNWVFESLESLESVTQSVLYTLYTHTFARQDFVLRIISAASFRDFP